jgi:adenylate cyclase
VDRGGRDVPLGRVGGLSMPVQILVVDDEVDLELLVTQKFRRQIRDGEFRFLFAHDGLEALAVLAVEREVDLVLSDINMPRMDGLTFLDHLSQLHEDLKAVIVSAYGDIANIRTAMNRGAFDFLTKPIAFDDLEAIIRKALTQVQKVRDMRRARDNAERAKSALTRYFSPNLADQLASNPDFLQLGAARRPGTFIFTDLADFTTLVESSEPAEIVGVLNRYLDSLTQIVFAHEGTVVKLLGDSVYAMFGAPVAQPDHAARAIDCALAIDAFARAFEAEQHAAGIALGVTRIGVNTGSAIIGNFGGESFFDYTAHGDPINVAARLEGANKYLGTRICVSATTAAEIPHFHGRPIGELVLKGRREELMTYEPLTRDAFSEAQLEAYGAAFATLGSGDPALARQKFAAYVGRYGDDPLALFHLQRLLGGECTPRVELREK